MKRDDAFELVQETWDPHVGDFLIGAVWCRSAVLDAARCNLSGKFHLRLSG